MFLNFDQAYFYFWPSSKWKNETKVAKPKELLKPTNADDFFGSTPVAQKTKPSLLSKARVSICFLMPFGNVESIVFFALMDQLIDHKLLSRPLLCRS